MNRLIPLLMLAIVGCSPTTNVVADEIGGSPDPPSTGTSYDCNGQGDTFTLFSNGKIQVSQRMTVSLPFAVTCHPSEEVFDAVFLCEGTLSNNAISGGKLKSVFTRSGPGGPFTVYWPATNGTATGVLNRFTMTAPMTGTWDGSTWTVTITGYCQDPACAAHSSSFGGAAICYGQ